MVRVTESGDLDHTVSFSPPVDPVQLSPTATAKLLKGRSDITRRQVSKKYGVTNTGSGFKWWYDKGGARTARVFSKSTAKKMKQHLFLAKKTDTRVARRSKKERKKVLRKQREFEVPIKVPESKPE